MLKTLLGKQKATPPKTLSAIIETFTTTIADLKDLQTRNAAHVDAHVAQIQQAEAKVKGHLQAMQTLDAESKQAASVAEKIEALIA